jgi:hypothetical protein
MTIYTCFICNKVFNRMCNYKYHMEDKKRPCSSENTKEESKNTENLENIHENESNNIYDLLFNMTDKLKNVNLINSTNMNVCLYCDKTFTRYTSLQRHLKERCKSKMYFDELELLKERLNNIVIENEKFKQEITELKETTLSSTNITNSHNTKNQINNGVINNNNNNVTVQLVQFGCENIDNIDSNEALNVYSKSTGGNILSNILKLINLNDKYPQNHNICISDLSRELVKIFNGKKFVVKKFKDIKGDIMYKVIRNTHKIVDKIENDDSIILTANLLSKLRINNVSVKLINGSLPEDIVRDEVREKDQLFKTDDKIDDKINDKTNDINSKKERDFNLEERLRIKHLESKQQGLIDISLERLKDELYNGKDLIENSENIVKNDKKKKYLKIV